MLVSGISTAGVQPLTYPSGHDGVITAGSGSAFGASVGIGGKALREEQQVMEPCDAC